LNIRQMDYQDRYLKTYLTDFAQMRDLYEYDPKDPQSVTSRIRYLDQVKDSERLRSVGRALLVYNQKFGCSAKTEENIQMLAAGNAYAVVTGQQTGLVTGPLYTVYKIMTAISLAQKVSAEHGILVVPVFWAASEDHDFQEISTLAVVNDRFEIVEKSVPSPNPGRISVGYLPLTERIRECIDFLADSTADGSHRDHYLEVLQETFNRSDNISEWCTRIIAELFSRYGLIMMDSMDPAMRALSSDVFSQAVMQNDAIHTEIENASSQIEAMDFKRQLILTPDVLTVFYNTEDGRQQIQQTDSGRLTVHGDESMSWTVTELAEAIAEEPQNFSPNVVLRPMVQDHLLPTLHYVAGPGELAYYGQLKGVYPIMEKQMPIIYPRFSATLVPPEIANRLERLGLEPEDIMTKGREELDRLMQEKAPFSVAERFAKVRAEITSAYADLTRDIIRIDSDLERITEGNLGRILHQVEYLESKTQQKVRKREKNTVQEFESVLTYLQPGNHLQERTVNVFPFLFHYGDQLLTQIMNAEPHQSFAHTLIFLGDDDHR
jgi:bacillithiol synthase